MKNKIEQETVGRVVAGEVEGIQRPDGFCSVTLSNSDSLVATVWGADEREAEQRAALVVKAINGREELLNLVRDFAEHLRDARNELVTDHKLAMLDGGIALELIERAGEFVDARDKDVIDANKVTRTVAGVVKHLRERGIDASHEFQDVVMIDLDEHRHWSFGTANDYWSGDMCYDHDAQWSVTLPFLSTHVSDGKDIAESIADGIRAHSGLHRQVGK